MHNQTFIAHLMHSVLISTLPINYFLLFKIKNWTTGKDTGNYFCFDLFEGLIHCIIFHMYPPDTVESANKLT